VGTKLCDLGSLGSEGHGTFANTINAEGGAGERPTQEELLGSSEVAAIKGRNMMVDRYAEKLGVFQLATEEMTADDECRIQARILSRSHPHHTLSAQSLG
jgi:hypothetical protein